MMMSGIGYLRYSLHVSSQQILVHSLVEIVEGRQSLFRYFLIRTLNIHEWYVVWCSSKIGLQKDMWFKEIGLRAQSMITIIANIIGRDLYDHLMSTTISWSQ